MSRRFILSDLVLTFYEANISEVLKHSKSALKEEEGENLYLHYLPQ